MNKFDIMAGIEEMLEQGPVCAYFISGQFPIDIKRAQKYLHEMKRDKLVEKVGLERISGATHAMYRLKADEPEQMSMMIDGEAKRDWLVAAFFGEAK